MDAPSPTSERQRELADLRRRAYGPDADIHRDPDALRRLNELEDLERVQPPSPIDVPSRPRDAPMPESVRSSPAPVLPPSTIAAEVVARSADDSAFEPGRRWWRRMPVWTVAAMSLAAGLAIGGWAVGLAQQSDAADPGPDLTLSLTSAAAPRTTGFAQNLAYWDVDSGSVVAYSAFDSIGVWTGRRSDESRCILLSPGGKIFTAACAASGLDPVFDFTVHANVPVSFQGHVLPEGSVVRFIARSHGVDVWARKSGATLTDLQSWPITG